MRNNVASELTERLAERGLIALRFNYRGVSGSEGPAIDVAAHFARFWETSHVPDELDHHLDLEAAIDFLRTAAPAGLSTAAIGYSFGCVLLPLVKKIEELSALVLIAPTVAKHNYDAYLTLNRPMLVIAPEDDFATEAAVVRRWYDQLSAPKQIVTTRLDNHFFRGHEAWLTETIFDYLSAHWS
jgi:alpha/beta superfamily hydrolase